MRISFKNWKKRLLSTSVSTFPGVDGITCASSVNSAYIFSYGNELKCDDKKCEALFVYKIAYDEYQRSCNAPGMTNSISQMIATVQHTKRGKASREIARKLQHLGKDAMNVIDASRFLPDDKVSRKAECLHEMGALHLELHEYETAIVKFEECIAMMQHELQDPSRYFVYGAAFHKKRTCMPCSVQI